MRSVVRGTCFPVRVPLRIGFLRYGRVARVSKSVKPANVAVRDAKSVASQLFLQDRASSVAFPHAIENQHGFWSLPLSNSMGQANCLEGALERPNIRFGGLQRKYGKIGKQRDRVGGFPLFTWSIGNDEVMSRD